jgi:hypothetical protein
MALRLRTRTRTDLEDLIEIEDDARVVAVEGFRAHAMSVAVERGRYFKLSDPVVRAHPQFFCVVVPVSDVLGEIER